MDVNRKDSVITYDWVGGLIMYMVCWSVGYDVMLHICHSYCWLNFATYFPTTWVLYYHPLALIALEVILMNFGLTKKLNIIGMLTSLVPETKL